MEIELDIKYKVKVKTNIPYDTLDLIGEKTGENEYIMNLSSNDVVWFHTSWGPDIVPVDHIEDIEPIPFTEEEKARQKEQEEFTKRREEHKKFISRVVASPNRIKRITKYDEVPTNKPEGEL